MLQRHGLVPHADGQSQHCRGYTLVSMSCHIVLAVIEHGCNTTSFTNALIGDFSQYMFADTTIKTHVFTCRCWVYTTAVKSDLSMARHHQASSQAVDLSAIKV